jgi:hypothetical protein
MTAVVRWAYAVALIGALAPSARAQSAYHPSITVDESTRWRVVLVDLGPRPADSACAGLPNPVDPVIAKTSNGELSVLSFAVTTITPAWLYQGETPADLTMDTRTMRLEAGIPPRRWVSGYNAPDRETGTYEVAPAQLVQLARAGHAEMRVSGAGGACAFAITKQDQVIIRSFLRAEYSTVAIALR